MRKINFHIKTFFGHWIPNRCQFADSFFNRLTRKGIVDEVVIFNRGLTEEEVDSLMEQGVE